MRDYSGATLELKRIPVARFLEDRWSWRVHIPAWMADGGIKASGANPSGTAMTRSGAIAAAERAVRRQQEEDQALVEALAWSETWEGFISG